MYDISHRTVFSDGPICVLYRRDPVGLPCRHARKAVGAVADQGQVVGNRLGHDSEFLDDTGLIPNDAVAAIQLHDARAHNALPEILVGCADHDLVDRGFARGLGGGRGEGVIRLEPSTRKVSRRGLGCSGRHDVRPVLRKLRDD